MEVLHIALNHFAGAERVIHKDNPGVAQALQKSDTHSTCAYKVGRQLDRRSIMGGRKNCANTGTLHDTEGSRCECACQTTIWRSGR